MIGLPNPYIALGAVVAFSVAVGGAYWKGRTDGRDLKVAEIAKATMKQLEERGVINETVRDADIADICVELGGLPDECAN